MARFDVRCYNSTGKSEAKGRSLVAKQQKPDADVLSNRGGRPRVLSDRKVEATFFRALEAMRSIPRAARIAGIDRDIVYKERDRNPEFAAKIEAAMDADEFKALEAVRKHQKDDWRAAAWSLERKQWKRYGRRDPLAVTPEMIQQVTGKLLERLLHFIPEERQAEATATIQNDLRQQFSQIEPDTHDEDDAASSVD